ncbi:MAG: outer membrane lipoprotein carrier protein LolA [Rudaea sp.]|uniref:LolA-related protein n=1 Tax=Rudaea sp. TaxID=2136325 RepID=UPI0039E6E42D
MISGIVLLSALTFAPPPPPLPAEPAAETAKLVASLRREPPSRTAYTEVRFVRMLKRPLVLHGELGYGGPGSLSKRVDAPYRETTTIAGNDVRVQREGKGERSFSLDRAPELGVLLSGFSALLGGDGAALNRDFSVEAVQRDADWRLTLKPRSPALAKQLSAMIVDGRGGEPRCFTLREADGDASTMLLGDLSKAALPDPPTREATAGLCGESSR